MKTRETDVFRDISMQHAGQFEPPKSWRKVSALLLRRRFRRHQTLTVTVATRRNVDNKRLKNLKQVPLTGRGCLNKNKDIWHVYLLKQNVVMFVSACLHVSCKFGSGRMERITEAASQTDGQGIQHRGVFSFCHVWLVDTRFSAVKLATVGLWVCVWDRHQLGQPLLATNLATFHQETV